MSVSVACISKCFCKVNVFSVSYVNRRGRCSAKFMVVSIGEICTEFYFVYMRISHSDSLTGNCAETMIVTFTASIYGSCASRDFVNMLLTIIAIRVIIC